MDDIMKVIKVHKHFLGGYKDVTLEVPEFENFGRRLEELEHLADEANPVDVAEVQASTAKLMAGMQELQQKAHQKLEATEVGPKKLMDAMMLELLAGMAKGVSESEEEQAHEDDLETEEEPPHRNLQRLTLSLPKGTRWNKETQSLVEKFFADWAQTRRVVLKATFAYYKKIYPQALTLFPRHKGLKFILPKPSSAEAVADLFYITSIYLHADGAIGLSGHCTWDEEHGYGIRLKNGNVTAVGEADVAFC